MKYLLVLLLLVGCGVENTKPEFNIGDCVTQHIKFETNNEFEENRIVEYDKFFKVIKVGKKNYLTKSFTTNYPTIILEMEYEFWYLSQFKKSKCPEGF